MTIDAGVKSKNDKAGASKIVQGRTKSASMERPPPLMILDVTRCSDRKKKLTGADRKLVKDVRKVCLAYAKPEGADAKLPEEKIREQEEMELEDALSDAEPAEQWKQVDSVNAFALALSLSRNALNGLLEQPAGHAPTVEANAHISSASTEHDEGMIANGERTFATSKGNLTKAQLQQLSDTELCELLDEATFKTMNIDVTTGKFESLEDKNFWEDLVRRTSSGRKLLNDARAAEAKKAAIQEAEKVAQAAIERLNAARQQAGEAPVPTQVKTETQVRPELTDEDYFEETDDEKLTDLDRPITLGEFRPLEDRQRTTSLGLRAAFQMIREARGREQAQLLCWKPNSWSPQEFQSALIEMRDLGHFRGSGFGSITERGTPIRIYLEAECDWRRVTTRIQEWYPEISTALDSPTENGQQVQQARDLLRVVINLENGKVKADGNAAEARRFSVQGPLKRLSKRQSTGQQLVDVTGDWWSVKDDKDKVIARVEYEHDKSKMTYRFSVPALKVLYVTAEQLKNLITEKVAELYEWDVVFTTRGLSPVQRAQIAVKEEEQPPQPLSITAGAQSTPLPMQPNQPQHATTLPPQAPQSGGKGGKGKGKHNGGKGKGKADKGKKGKNKNAGKGKTVWNNYDYSYAGDYSYANSSKKRNWEY